MSIVRVDSVKENRSWWGQDITKILAAESATFWHWAVCILRQRERWKKLRIVMGKYQTFARINDRASCGVADGEKKRRSDVTTFSMGQHRSSRLRSRRRRLLNACGIVGPAAGINRLWIVVYHLDWMNIILCFESCREQNVLDISKVKEKRQNEWYSGTSETIIRECMSWTYIGASTYIYRCI